MTNQGKPSIEPEQESRSPWTYHTKSTKVNQFSTTIVRISLYMLKILSRTTSSVFGLIELFITKCDRPNSCYTVGGYFNVNENQIIIHSLH